MDAIFAEKYDISVYYGLISVQDLPFEKMDAKFVKQSAKQAIDATIQPKRERRLHRIQGLDSNYSMKRLGV
jgi:hypothetical protein